MRKGHNDLNKLSSSIMIHKTIELILSYDFFLSLRVNFLKLDFLKII
jgi:hypothetical protein